MTSAARRHRVLIVGVGSIGERHLRCFLATDRADVLFVEPNEALRETIARRYTLARSISTVPVALDEGIDCAVIATPAPLHIPLANTIVRRGANVLIEKPLSVSHDGIATLRELVADHGTIAAVAYVYRAHPALAAMRNAIRSGEFGRPLQLVAVAGQHFPTYRPAYRETYYGSHASGGGAVQDALTHVINAGEWLVGPVTRLTADVAHLALPGVDVEDTANVLARHGETIANYSLNQHQAPNETTITVLCERGAARFEVHGCRWRSMTEPGGQWTDHHFGPLERDELFTRQANAFLDAVERKSSPLCNLDEGVSTLSANIAILESARSGAWQEIGR